MKSIKYYIYILESFFLLLLCFRKTLLEYLQSDEGCLTMNLLTTKSVPTNFKWIQSTSFITSSSSETTMNVHFNIPIQYTNIVLDILILISALISMLASIFAILIMIFSKSTNSTDRTARLLSINMYFSLFIGCGIMFDIYCYTLYGHLYPNVSFDGFWCHLKAYFFYVSGCAFFYSYLLQAVYRLCRIVFYRKPSLQSYRLYIYGVIIQWTLSFIQVLPILFLGTFEYLPSDYHCQIALNNIYGLIIGLSLVHMIPITLPTLCYGFTMIYIRRRSATIKSRRQQTNDRRDAIVLTRVFILLFVLIISGLPTLGISLFSKIYGFLPYWSTQFQWLTATFSIACVSIILLLVSPDLDKFWKRPRQRTTSKLQTKSDCVITLV